MSMVNGKFDDGMRLYQVALDTVGNDPKIISKLAFNMGIGFHRFEKEEQACKCFGMAVKLDPENGKAKTNYAKLSKSNPDIEIPDDRSQIMNSLKDINTMASTEEEGDSGIDHEIERSNLDDCG